MKKIVLLNSAFLILHSALFAQSPNWQWAKGIGGTGGDFGGAIAIDASGNVYTTGSFNGTVDFDPGAGIFNLTGGGTFISKLDSTGNFIWAKAIVGTTNYYGGSIAIDPAGSGNVYTTGDFVGTADFDPGAGIFNLTAAGGRDFFISKLDSSGNFVWAKAMGGTSDDGGHSIAIDPSGSGTVYTTGIFEGTADFDPGAGVFNLTSAGWRDIFISKLDSSGNFVWAKAMGGTGDNQGRSIAIDPAGSGDVYTTGFFYGTADFDPGAGTFNLTSAAASADIFISKLDSSGNFVWAKQIGGTGSSGGASYSIAIDASGYVYTSGGFLGTVDFDPGVGVFNLTASPAGYSDIFISKLDSSGIFVWAKSMGGTGNDYSLSIAIDPAGNGNVYTTGFFDYTADFDPGAGVFPLTVASFGYYDIFISKLDGSGNFVWAKAMGGMDEDRGHSIALGASGHVHVTGYFISPSITFGSTTLTNAGYADIFIAKLDTMTIITGNNDVSASLSMTGIFPNPFSGSTVISFSLTQSQKVSLSIFDVNGRLVTTLADASFEEGENEITWNAADVNAGIYFLRFESASYSENRKLIVAK